MTAQEFETFRTSIGTQQEVADMMETARRSIIRWEKGERAIPGSAAVCIRLLAKKQKPRK